jgi:hypothetical protein
MGNMGMRVLLQQGVLIAAGVTAIGIAAQTALQANRRALKGARLCRNSIGSNSRLVGR